jgi:hypothetical protein
MSKWIDFKEMPQTGKTKIYQVVPKEYPGSCLGEIKWYGSWRCYAFYPFPNCVFEKTCLKDITSFIENLMLQRKVASQNVSTHER